MRISGLTARCQGGLRIGNFSHSCLLEGTLELVAGQGRRDVGSIAQLTAGHIKLAHALTLVLHIALLEVGRDEEIFSKL